MSDVTQPTPQINVSAPTEADLKELMMGTNGNPSYEEQFGITSAPLGTTGTRPPTLAELEFQAKLAEARALDPTAFAATSNGQIEHVVDDGGQDELGRYKKLYGDSENEKGQLRKQSQELMEAFNGLMAQYEAIQAGNNSQNQWGGQVAPPQQQFVPQGYGQPQQGYNFDPFEGMGDDDVVQGKQIRRLIEQTVAPAVSAAFQQAQLATQRAAGLEQQLLAQAKAATGISKFDEYRLMAKNPWLQGLPPQAKLAALASLRQNEVTQSPVTSTQTASAESQQRIVNKVTYIEGSGPTQTNDSSQAAINAARERDYAIAVNKPSETGERARALRAFANKYGLNFGQHPSDLAR